MKAFMVSCCCHGKFSFLPGVDLLSLCIASSLDYNAISNLKVFWHPQRLLTIRIPWQGLEVATPCWWIVKNTRSPVLWLKVFSQVLWGRRVHQYPRLGCLCDGSTGRWAPDHPPGHRSPLETCSPVWKCQRSGPLPWHQDREHLCQSTDTWGHENNRSKCIWGPEEGGP
jgi:hypothetical protein